MQAQKKIKLTDNLKKETTLFQGMKKISEGLFQMKTVDKQLRNSMTQAQSACKSEIYAQPLKWMKDLLKLEQQNQSLNQLNKSVIVGTQTATDNIKNFSQKVKGSHGGQLNEQYNKMIHQKYTKFKNEVQFTLKAEMGLLCKNLTILGKLMKTTSNNKIFEDMDKNLNDHFK